MHNLFVPEYSSQQLGKVCSSFLSAIILRLVVNQSRVEKVVRGVKKTALSSSIKHNEPIHLIRLLSSTEIFRQRSNGFPPLCRHLFNLQLFLRQWVHRLKIQTQKILLVWHWIYYIYCFSIWMHCIKKMTMSSKVFVTETLCYELWGFKFKKQRL